MSWQLQLLLAWLIAPQGINTLFVLVSLAGAFGANPRVVALISALLYLMLVIF